MPGRGDMDLQNRIPFEKLAAARGGHHPTRRARLESNMISRQWRGLARRDRAQDYLEHLRADTFPTLRTLPGFVSASILSRPFGDGIEFLVVTQWRARGCAVTLPSI